MQGPHLRHDHDPARLRLARLAGLAATLAACYAAPASASQSAQLPDVSLPVTGSPPYYPGFPVGETRNPGRVANRELVVAGLDRTGRPRSVSVTQRLDVDGLGDIVFNIPAPAASVVRLPASQSTPGLRRHSVVWQGFSPGRKVLAARIGLRPGESGGILPVTVSVSHPAADRLLVTVSVVSPSIPSFTGRAKAAAVAAGVDRIWDALRTGSPVPGVLVTVPGAFRPKTLRLTPFFRLDGTLTLPGRLGPVSVTGGKVVGRSPLRIEVHRLLGDLHRSARVAVRTGRAAAGPPRLDLAVRPASSALALTPPGGVGWLAALRAGRLPRDGRKLLPVVLRRLEEVALTRQYDAALASPDPAGPTSTSYRFTTALAAPAAPVRATGGGGTSTLLVVVGAVLAVLAAAGLTVWWAHS